MPSLEELSEKVDQLNAQVDTEKKDHKEAMDNKDKEHKDAMDEKEKNAMDEKDKEAKKANDEKEKHESVLKAMHKAMDDEKDEKKKEGMKAVLEAMKADDTVKKINEQEGNYSNEDKEEKKAMKAEITYLASLVKKPIIDQLTQIYQGAKTPESDIKEYVADWNKMTPEQLDGALKKVAHLVGARKSYEAVEKKSPFGFSTGTAPGQRQFSASKAFEKIDKASDSDLFNKSEGPYA